MISSLRQTLNAIISELFSEWVSADRGPPYPDLPSTVTDALSQMPTNADAVQGVLGFAKNLYDETDARRATVEAKATTILGVVGLAGSLITASAGLLLNASDFVTRGEVWPLGILFVTTLSVFLYAAYKAVRSLRLAGWGYPGVLTLYQRDVSSAELNRQWAAHLLVAKAHNDSIVDEKGGWLKEAQAWFLLGLFLLLLTALTLLFVAALGAPPQDSPFPSHVR